MQFWEIYSYFSFIYHLLIPMPFAFKNPESDESLKFQNHCIKHIWPNLDETLIVMDQEKWENGETRLVEQLEYAIKPNQEKLEHVNIGTNDNIKELKVGTLIL